MPTAFPNISGRVFKLDSSFLEKGFKASRESVRKRIILPVHRTQDSLVQRMYNFMQPGTYIRPHKHPRPFASESICLLQGSIHFFVFDDFGKITDQFHLEAQNPTNAVIDIEPNVWHSFIVSEPDTLIFETKMGPYSITEDKAFAKWAPEEGLSEADDFHTELEKKKITS